MITKKIECDTDSCLVHEETLQEEALIAVGWLIRKTDDRLVLDPSGRIVGGESTKHYCPTHAKKLHDLHPRVKQEIEALETLAKHGNTAD